VSDPPDKDKAPTHRNVYVDDAMGRTYRVCFITGDPDTVEGWFVVRRLHRGDGNALFRDGRKALALLALARVKLRAELAAEKAT
jgi:hypothetical protein